MCCWSAQHPNHHLSQLLITSPWGGVAQVITANSHHFRTVTARWSGGNPWKPTASHPAHVMKNCYRVTESIRRSTCSNRFLVGVSFSWQLLFLIFYLLIILFFSFLVAKYSELWRFSTEFISFVLILLFFACHVNNTTLDKKWVKRIYIKGAQNSTFLLL